jgi:diacylglycerol kinase (ATP)
VGRVVLPGRGMPETRLFANHASCGLTGDVARRADAGGKRLGGTAAFLWATIQAFRAWSNVELAVRLDDDRLSLRGAAVVCSNGRYLGGGMHLAPEARQDDGLLDVLVIGDVGKADLALNVHRLYRGTLTRHPRVTGARAARIEVACDRALPAEIDGEVAMVEAGGTIAFDVLPRRLTLLTG